VSGLAYVINDTTSYGELLPGNRGRGLELGLRGPEGYAGSAEPFPTDLIIPKSEWQARIQEREERKATIWHRATAAGWKVKDQQQTNYCWINAPTAAVELIRLLQHDEPVVLSPASAGAQITNYRNVGGWGKEGLEWIQTHGLVPVSLWPANAISKQYATESNKQVALSYRQIEWWELAVRSLDQLVSCLLRGYPVAVGYNWWGHEVTACDPVWVDGAVAIRIANSWGEAWGDKGFGVIQGNRMLPDDACSPRTAVAA
jgi:hypothetical protein